MDLPHQRENMDEEKYVKDILRSETFEYKKKLLSRERSLQDRGSSITLQILEFQ